MRITLKFISTVFLAVLFFCGVSFATTIEYVATDLADTTAGEDLWQYEYTVSDNNFSVDHGFTIFFDYNDFGAIDPFPTSPNPDWDVLTWDPDPSLPDDGAFDALALVDSPSLANSFIVSFVWEGTSAPGSQYFEVYDFNTFDVLDSGDTIPGSAPVPEPGTMILFTLGLLGIARINRKS